MKIKNTLLKSLAIFASVAAAGTSYGAIISVSGSGVEIAAPTSTAVGQTEANTQQGFNEVQGLQLLSDLSIDGGGVISAGTWISSHLIFLDTVGSSGHTETASWIFDGDILGLLTGTREYNSSALLGNPATAYPNSGSSRGFEGGDSHSIAGNQFDVTMRVTAPGDWVRVVTAYTPENNAVPDAGSTGIMLMGAFLLALVGRRKFQK